MSYDANGSQTGKGSDSFNWNARNQLSGGTIGGVSFAATYDAAGLRQSRTVGGTTTQYIWDVGGTLPMLLDDGTQYVGGGLITPTGTFYRLVDGLGSTMAVIDATGMVKQTYGYDVCSAVRTSSGTQATSLQFAGEQTDPGGLQYLRARYCDPATGRFISRDPLSAGNPIRNHPYTYGNDRPTSDTDPSGLGFFSFLKKLFKWVLLVITVVAAVGQ